MYKKLLLCSFTLVQIVFLHAASIESTIKSEVLFESDFTKIIICSESDLHEHLKNHPQRKVYSTNKEVIDFTFNQCLRKFVNSIKREDDVEVGTVNGIHSFIAVFDILRFTTKFYGDKKADPAKVDFARSVCNGDYTPQFKPLHYAIKYHKKIDTAKVLIEHGTCVSAVDEYGKSPLMYALDRAVNVNDSKMFALLIKHGASIHEKLLEENDTTLDYAKKDCKAFMFLIKNAEKVNLVKMPTKEQIRTSPLCRVVDNEK